MMKFFVDYGVFGQWFETYEEAEQFCGMAGYSCKNIYEVEEEEEA
jgi:hypothetical protein